MLLFEELFIIDCYIVCVLTPLNVCIRGCLYFCCSIHDFVVFAFFDVYFLAEHI